jgi:hypothetical protein
MQNVEAGIIQDRNRNQLSGLGGMSGIEGQRLDAQLKAGMYNADAQSQAQARNIAAGESAASRGAASDAMSTAQRLQALGGMTSLYGTTPGQSELFGNQLLNAVGQGGTFGTNLMGRDIESQGLPGQYDQTMSRARDVGNIVSQYGIPIMDAISNRNKPQQQAQAPSYGGGVPRTTTSVGGTPRTTSGLGNVTFGQQGQPQSSTQARRTNTGMGTVRF